MPSGGARVPFLQLYSGDGCVCCQLLPSSRRRRLHRRFCPLPPIAPARQVVPANMECAIDEDLAEKLAAAGFFYILHRFRRVFCLRKS